MTYLDVTEPVNSSNEDLWERTKQMPIEKQIKKENGVGLVIH